MITAWLGSEEIKRLTLDRMEQHRDLDRIAQGVYWEGGRGCHLGCLTHEENGGGEAHRAAARLFGLPLRVCYWLESIFEGLPKERAPWWAVESLRAIPVGADLSLAHHHFAAWLLGPDSPSATGNNHPLVAEQVVTIRGLHESAARGEPLPDGVWSAALSAAESAAESAAARSAALSALSAARSAALSAAESTAWSARSAAESAAARSAALSALSAARSAALSAAWESIATTTIAIFSASPIATCDVCDAQRESTLIHLRSIDLAVA